MSKTAETDPLVNQLDPSIKDNVAKMIDDAEEQYDVTVRVNQTQRTKEQAQTFHVLHMFLRNRFKNLRPKVVADDGRTISWAHLSDADVKWALIDDLKAEFLLTADGRPATLRVGAAGGKKWVVDPDKAASARAMAKYLRRHKVLKIAAPGLDGCGEPCGCGGHASKHVSGKAADLGGLQELGEAIRAAEPGKYSSADDAVDHFLHAYHLWRPLANLDSDEQELWHVEAEPVHALKAPKKKKAAGGHKSAKSPHSARARHHAAHARRHGGHPC